MLERVRYRVCLACAATLALASGCAKSPEGEQAEFAMGDKPGQFMPPARTAADLTPLLDQTSVTVGKKIDIKYGPLKKSAADADSKGGKKPSTKQPKGAAGKLGKKAAVADGQPAKRSALGKSLSGAMGLLSGKKPMPSLATGGTPPKASEDDEEEAPATPVKAEKAKLEDPRDPMQEMPAAPKEYSADQIKAVQAAARAEAIKNLMRVAYAMPLDPTSTVGEAIGQPAEKFPSESISVRVVSATWTDDTTFEVEVQISTGDLITAMANTFEGVVFEPLREQLAADKAISAKGSAEVPGLKKPAGGPAKPGSKKSKKGSGTG